MRVILGRGGGRFGSVFVWQYFRSCRSHISECVRRCFMVLSQIFTTIASHDWAYWIHPGDLGFILWCELVFALIIAYLAIR